MKCFSTLTLVLMSALIISACGARGTQATPTVDVVALQGTMAAAALTMVAQTQAAIPTATPIPPTATFTNTPLPTNTLPPLTPSGATVFPSPNANPGGGDPCVNQPLPATLQGETVRLRINNSTRVTLALSVYLNQTTPQVVCGYRTYTIEPQQSLILNNLVEGCYTLWAWNPDPEGYFIVTNGAASCIDSSDTAVFDISTRSIEPK
jgi:hypothetical protein